MKSRTSASCDEEKDESMDTVGKKNDKHSDFKALSEREREREAVCF